MSVELLNKEHLSEFLNATKNTKNRIRIVSPFIGFETSKQLANSLIGSGIECTIITRFYREDFLNHASSLDGLKLLANAGFKIYALIGLHSKLYIFDDELAILGSANFTMGGLRLNHELSLIIDGEDELITKLCDFYDDLLSNIKSSGEWEIGIEKIENEMKIVDKLIKDRKDKTVKYENTQKFGATLSTSKAILETDFIEGFIREENDSGFTNGIWLKFVGSGEDRYNPNAVYTKDRIVRDNKNLTSFPRIPRGIGKDDYVYLAAISWDNKNAATPMIVARARTNGYQSGNVVTDEERKNSTKLNNYPYFIELYDIEILNLKISECISLDQVIRGVGSNLYPSTKGKVLSVAELKSRHYQKSHLKITPTAKNYIDDIFENIGKSSGINKL